MLSVFVGVFRIDQRLHFEDISVGALQAGLSLIADRVQPLGLPRNPIGTVLKGRAQLRTNGSRDKLIHANGCFCSTSCALRESLSSGVASGLLLRYIAS